MGSNEMRLMDYSNGGRGFLSGQPMPKHGESLYPLLLLLAFHEDYEESGITRPALVTLSRWHPGRVAGAVRRAYERGFIEYGGRQRPPSVFARWSNLNRLTALGRQAAFELFDQGKFFAFSESGELYLRQGSLVGGIIEFEASENEIKQLAMQRPITPSFD